MIEMGYKGTKEQGETVGLFKYFVKLLNLK